MSTLHTAHRYLVEHLRQIKNVKAVRVLDEGALHVSLNQYTFDEEIVIYLLAGELSLNFIKKALNGNTREDIHTLFILSLDLLSDERVSGQANPGLQLLLAAYGNKVFAYTVSGQEVSIFPVYIDRQWRITRGEPVELPRLNGDYAEINTKYILGVRKVANFNARDFHHAPAARPAYDPLQPFYELLGVTTSATLDEVKKAYRKKARQHHPDRDKSPDATERMQQINIAYERILERLG